MYMYINMTSGNPSPYDYLFSNLYIIKIIIYIHYNHYFRTIYIIIIIYTHYILLIFIIYLKILNVNFSFLLFH